VEKRGRGEEVEEDDENESCVSHRCRTSRDDTLARLNAYTPNFNRVW
jgi:hypothetical protein